MHMKRMILGVSMVAALLLTASSAMAQGLSLRWQSCIGDGGVSNRTSACTSNLGNAGIAVGTFQVGADVIGATGIEALVDVITTDPATLPAWWTMPTTGFPGFPGCRSGAITANGTISTAAVNCFDWASGAAAGGLAAFKTNQPIGANTARILVGLAVPAASAATIPANTEMFAFNLVISNTKTTGTGSCAGCTTAACLVFQNLKIAIGTSNAAPISTGNTAGSNFATWQGTAASCAAVPTRNSTWSGVKSLYR